MTNILKTIDEVKQAMVSNDVMDKLKEVLSQDEMEEFEAACCRTYSTLLALEDFYRVANHRKMIKCRVKQLTINNNMGLYSAGNNASNRQPVKNLLYMVNPNLARSRTNK